MSVKDTGLLEVSGMTAADAAQILGRSRQAVSRGIKRTDDYFSLDEVESLVVKELQEPRAELPERVKRYIIQNYSELASLVGGNPREMTFEKAQAEAKRVWLFIPRYTALSTSSPLVHQSIVDLITRTDKKITVFVQGQAEADRFNAMVDKATRGHHVALDHILLIEQCEFLAIMPTLLIFNPDMPTSFVLGEADKWSSFNREEVQCMLERLLKDLKAKNVTPHE